MDDTALPIARSELERRFTNLVENIPGLVVYLDVVPPEGPESSVPVYISPQVEQLLGYPREAWLTEDELWLDVLHPDDRERMVAADIAARSALAPHFAEYRMIARDGRVVWVSEKAAVVKDELTGDRVLAGRDGRHHRPEDAEEALAASERQYRSVFDAATIGLLTVDLQGASSRRTRWSSRCSRIPPGSLAGMSLMDDLDADDAIRQGSRRSRRAAKTAVELEHRFGRTTVRRSGAAP